MPRSSTDDQTIATVENFIRRLRCRELLFEPRINEIVYTFKEEIKDSIYPKKYRKSLATLLGSTMTDYEEHRNDKHKVEYAYKCLRYINYAYTNAVVQERESVEQKLKECTEKNVQLQKELEKVTANYEGLRRLYPNHVEKEGLVG